MTDARGTRYRIKLITAENANVPNVGAFATRFAAVRSKTRCCFELVINATNSRITHVPSMHSTCMYACTRVHAARSSLLRLLLRGDIINFQ